MNYLDGIMYANQVAKGEIEVCRNVRLACQRFLNQYENKEWEWEFDPDYPNHLLGFASLLKHTKGHQAGQNVILEPFQIFFICAIYGFRAKKDHSKRWLTDGSKLFGAKTGRAVSNRDIQISWLRLPRLL